MCDFVQKLPNCAILCRNGQIVRNCTDHTKSEPLINTKTKSEREVNWRKSLHNHTKLTLSNNAKTIKQDFNKSL